MAKTVSLDMAQRLKEAGLRWEPKEGDVVLDTIKEKYFVCVCVDNYQFWLEPLGYNDECIMDDIEEAECYLWIPTLSDLLELLEKAGYRYDVVKRNKYRCDLWQQDEEGIWDMVGQYFQADTPEDATGEAVLWVLEQKGQK